jgi:hypothetical protein
LECARLSRGSEQVSCNFMFPLLLLAAALPHFQQQTISEDLRGGYQVVAVDVNKDGKPDLIALASGMDELVWYENPTWERHVMARSLKQMINLAALDTDGDGIPEILVAHGFNKEAAKSTGIVSLLHSGADPRELWTIREIDRIPTAHRLRIIDFDGSGRKVFLNVPLTGAKAAEPDYKDHAPIVFYRPGEWKREPISEANEGVQHGVWIDGHSFLTASFSGIHRYEYKNKTWKRTELAKGDPSPCPKCGSSDVALTRDGLIVAIEPWHGNQVVVYKKGKREVIDDQLNDGHTIITADLDGDGKDEIIAAQRGKPYQVIVYTRAGSGWKKDMIDDGMSGAACTAMDLDGDGRVDLACIGGATHNLKVYWNKP